MKYYIDTEFHEYKKNGVNTIELISIAIVTDKGNELYLVSYEFDLAAACKNEWLHDNVIKKLPIIEEWVSLEYIKEEILKLTRMMDKCEFYGYFCDYDWVVFCWLFGRMIDLPGNFPMFCIDLKQMMEERGLDKEWKRQNCPEDHTEHNALADARWNAKLHTAINKHGLIVLLYR